MRIIAVQPLVRQVPEQFSPSGANWILKCPLRGLFKNKYNSDYLLQRGHAAAAGNIIHAVLDSNNRNRVQSEDEFDRLWHLKEQSEQEGGLKYLLKNYARYKYNTKKLVLKTRTGNGRQRIPSAYTVLSERWFTSADCLLSGRPDLLVLKNNLPYEIKDFKTGQIFREDIPEFQAGEVGDYYHYLKEEFHNQLLLYASLVWEKYGSYPRRLTIVTDDGNEISGACIPSEVSALAEKIRKLHRDLARQAEHSLANPTATNCLYCNYKPGCPFRIISGPAPFGDLTGKVTAVRIHDYGNFSVSLDGGQQIFMPRPYSDTQIVSQLEGKALFLNNVSAFPARPGVYNFTKFSLIYILHDEAVSL